MPKYKFEQLAHNITDKKMPKPGDEELYVGLEHLDSGNLNVTRWGSKVELIGQKLVMKQGDILFGRRNTYLRRASIAPHDGIFSAHGMIFRPRIDVIDPDYFPFFISSNYFMDAAINISVGSLSPTVNWKTLKELEFNIPTLDKQKKTAELLKSINTTKEAYQELLFQSDELIKAKFTEMFDERFENNRIKLNEIANPIIGLTYKPENKSEDGTLVLRSGNVQNGEMYIGDDIVRVKEVKIPEHKYIIPNDILMCSRNGSADLVGKNCIIRKVDEKMTFGAFMTVIRTEFPNFLFGFFQSDYFKTQLNNVGTTSINQITSKMLNEYEVVLPTVEEEKTFAVFLKQVEKSKYELKRAIQSTENLIKSMLYKELEREED
ncbi:restriction endonuclease subunit S [Enterococcus casseliflavus]|uniref:restriction endonuclease subunit S n=1 Tax=Enterococcus casseliflavus TaxID=37734 RepID=UPI0035CBF733